MCVGKIREHRRVMGAVGRGRETPAPPGLQPVFAHQTAYLLAVSHRPLLTQSSADTPVPVVDLPRFGGQVEAVATNSEVGDSRWK